uniref:Tc1-like transposase DDE domain-containing protein n=1 Tax=Eptatretus burgeri TaxID=7764 RepID=A0A8C4X193_EPTBU
MRILKIEFKKVIFQHDNVPAHTAKATKKWLEKKSLKLVFWSGRSRDLNPRVKFWAYIQHKLIGRKFANSDQLWEAVKREWDNIDISRCKKLSESLTKRLDYLKKAKGQATPSILICTCSYFCMFWCFGGIFNVW